MKGPAKGDKILLKRDGGPVIEETCHQSHKDDTRYGMMCDHIGRFSGDDNLKVVTFSTIFSPA